MTARRLLVRRVLKRLVGPQPKRKGQKRTPLNQSALSDRYVCMRKCEDNHWRLIRPLSLTRKAMLEAML